MALLLLFLIGAALGGVSNVLRTGVGPRRPLIDVMLGTIGALFGGLSLARLVGEKSIGSGDVELVPLALAVGSAAALLALLNLGRRVA